jgi:hypothetical protein
LPPVDPGPPFFVDHFLHNLLDAALIFPTSPQLLRARDIIKGGEGVWIPRWRGDLHPLAVVMLSLALASVALGIGLAVQRDYFRGLAPLAALLLYLGANSLARTSGGRYLVPVDWVLILYFAVAVAELVPAVAGFVARGRRGQPPPLPSVVTGNTEARTRRPSPRAWPGPSGAWTSSRFARVFGPLLLLGGLVPLAGVLYPPRYGSGDGAALLQQFQAYNPRSGTADAELQAFLQQPSAVLVEGRLLYPLYYPQGVGEPVRYAPYTVKPYPRTVFVLIGPRGIMNVVLPGDRPERLPNATDAIVLGCQYFDQNFNMLAAVAVVLPQQQMGIARSPQAPLKCPIAEPVCDPTGRCD